MQPGAHRPLKALEKRIPSNPKYAGVKTKVDSGFNEIKFNEKFELSKLNARFRRDENFRRLKPSTFAQIFHQNDMDYLLLDMRDPDDYSTCHIHGALNYPAPTLSRSVNNFTPEILAYSNKEPDKVIIIYDSDERITVPAGNLFFEKGVDNVFVLTGGLKALAAEHPELAEGQLPAPALRRPASPAGSVRSSTSNRSMYSTYSQPAGRRPAPNVAGLAKLHEDRQAPSHWKPAGSRSAAS